MSTEMSCYDYVNQPFEIVRRAILRDPQALFRGATSSGRKPRLHVGVGGLDLGAEIELELGTVTEDRESLVRPKTTLALSWRGCSSASWFPIMIAELAIYPLSPTETQLEITGTYQPPLGVIGGAVDAVALRKLAEESVSTFVREVAAHLRTTLSAAQALA